MAEQEAWTLGAAPECDILIDHPTVSGRHCRLTRDGTGFLLEDLDSTNGTFVNGARVTAPIAVTSSDDVRLGPETPLPWEKIEPPPADRKIIRIGRTADNDVVLDYANVSGNHARIIVENGRSTIEDLGSTNGVAIGRPENLTKSAALNEGDTVYFGTLAVPAADLLNPGRPPSVIQSTAAPEGGSSISPRTIGIAAASLVVLVVAVGAASRLFKGDEPPVEQQPAEVEVATDDTGEPETPVESPTQFAEKPADAIYAVLVQNQGTSQLLHIGTAWVVGEHQLVTSGVVARYLEKYRKDLTAIQVSCASLSKVFVVTQVHVHPEFKKAEIAIKQPLELAQEKRQKLDEIQSAKEPPGKEEIDKLVNELIEVEEQLYLTGERMLFYDIGMLVVEENLPFALSLQVPGRKMAIQSKTSLYGSPYDPESMSSEAELTVANLQGKLLQIAPPTDEKQSPLRRLRISSPADHHVQKEWRGSPVINDEGTVIGVYARPSPPVDPSKPTTGKSFDAVLIDQLSGLPADPLKLQSN